VSVLKIAWRSIQHRGVGSFLTILSMALGIMMVVSVISIHGIVSRSFQNNKTFGYNVLVGARGGAVQLTMSSVFYLAPPVENIPYEYYLAFESKQLRQKEMRHSLAWIVHQQEQSLSQLQSEFAGGPLFSFGSQLATAAQNQQQEGLMQINESGLFGSWVHTVVPINLGDFWVDEEKGLQYRCVGTKPTFFEKLVLNIDTEQKFEFAEGRPFQEYNGEHGFNELVIGSVVARESGLKIGDTIQPTHGDPNMEGSHIHETDFYVVGILEPTGTPNDRVLFLNLEGFYLMEGHEKTIIDESPRGIARRQREALEAGVTPQSDPDDESAPEHSDPARLPIERREVTSLLIRGVVGDDGADVVGHFLPGQINQGDLKTTLQWTPFTPERSQEAALAVNPVVEVTKLFRAFVDPIQKVLLFLTLLICLVSSISILVGIYSSMSQRKHEIAVMRALGASRTKVLMIMLCESVLMALLAGVLGWVAGHGLNALMSPVIESQAGIRIGFFDLAPSIPIAFLPGGSSLPHWLGDRSFSPELLVIPGLVVLAVLIGIYPAISAYRTDVSAQLGK